MTSPTSSLSSTQLSPLSESSDSSPCSPSQCCGSCQSGSATAATTAVSNESASEPSKSDFSVSTPNVSDSRDATLKTLTIHRDNRGNVRETFRASWFPEVPPIQQLVRSKSKAKTVRGMHLHRKQWDVWHFVKGTALVRLYDHAARSNYFEWVDAGTTIAIPPGLSHGFYTPAGCTLMYALTEEYDGSDEYGWYFSDGVTHGPRSGFADDWPTVPSDLNISLRDLGAARLAEFRA